MVVLFRGALKFCQKQERVSVMVADFFPVQNPTYLVLKAGYENHDSVVAWFGYGQTCCNCNGEICLMSVFLFNDRFMNHNGI